jgi:hypothetical protein
MWGNPFKTIQDFTNRAIHSYLEWGSPTEPAPIQAFPLPIAQPEIIDLTSDSEDEDEADLPRPWFNDEKVNGYIEALLKSHAAEVADLGFLDSLFLIAPSMKDFLNGTHIKQEKVLAQHQKTFREKSMLLIVHNTGNHWLLYVLDRKMQTGYAMDSLNYPIDQDLAASIQKFSQKIWPYDPVFSINKIKVPNQGNGVDCGPAVCEMTHHIVTRGIDCFLRWAEQNVTSYYDYGLFRPAVDRMPGVEIEGAQSASPIIFTVSRTKDNEEVLSLLDSDSEDEPEQDSKEGKNKRSRQEDNKPAKRPKCL